MDPTRLRDDPDQPRGLRDLLDHSVRDVGSHADIAKTAAKLLPLVGAGALGVLATSSAAKASVGAGKAWWVASVVAGSVAVAGVAVVTSVPSENKAPVVMQPPAPAPAPAMPKVVAVPQVDEAPPEIAPVPEVVAPRSAPKAQLRTAAPPPPGAAESTTVPAPAAPAAVAPAPAMPSESQLLGAAQSSLASDPARALKLTAEHRQLFPGGAFTQEREVIEIDALYRLGRKAEAERRATQFIARNPGSSYARRVKELMKRP
ncbi:MAG TPA: hypothetical protein VHO25_12840 [Polyangiaceae bacterium]|nr:hypothetical protein [Polyangiaceae bacterium]